MNFHKNKKSKRENKREESQNKNEKQKSIGSFLNKETAKNIKSNSLEKKGVKGFRKSPNI